MKTQGPGPLALRGANEVEGYGQLRFVPLMYLSDIKTCRV